MRRCNAQALPARPGPMAGALAMALVLLVGCESMDETQRGTAVGAGIGAGAGAVIGSSTGGQAGSGAVIGAAIGAIAGNLWSRHMEEKRRAMEQATAGTGIDVERTPENELKVNVPSDISFDSGRADIRPDLRPVLDQFANGLDQRTVVRIVGHTDSTGSDAINDPLSEQRARSVERYLVDRGVPAARIETAGRGSHQPIADNSTHEGRARNRRVEIFLREPEAGASRG